MKEKKLLGTGVSNFKDLIEYNYYYFDKKIEDKLYYLQGLVDSVKL